VTFLKTKEANFNKSQKPGKKAEETLLSVCFVEVQERLWQAKEGKTDERTTGSCEGKNQNRK